MSSSTLLELLDPAENAINEMIMLYDALDCPAATLERVRQFKKAGFLFERPSPSSFL